jgi:ribosomal protein S18 acetylase RimI-like enzyme
MGLGRELLGKALAWARLEQVEAVRLDTAPTMAGAQRFYEAAGFRSFGSRTEVGAGGTRCELLYRLAL